MQERAVNLISKYGNDFEKTFCKQFPTQNRGSIYPTLAYACRADTPTLVEVDNAYGANSARFWLYYQLLEVAIFCGARENFTDAQMVACAEKLRQQGFYVTMAEMMQFFDRFELGYYEKFYGLSRVNMQVITSSFNEFLKELAGERGHAENERLRKRQEEEDRKAKLNAVPCPEHIKARLEKLKKKFENGNNDNKSNTME